MLGATLQGVIKGDIGVVKKLLERGPLSTVILQTRVQEGQTLDGELAALREVVGASCYVLGEICLACTGEGRISGEHLVEDGAQRPNVSRVIIFVTIEHFWCHHEGCAKSCRRQLVLLKLPCEAQVGNFHLKGYSVATWPWSNLDVPHIFFLIEAGVEELIFG